MVRKIRVGIKKPNNITINQTKDLKNEVADMDTEHNTKKIDSEVEIPDTPTCIRCYIKGEKDIQALNGMLLRFNSGNDNLVIQRVGYKMIDNKIAEIDIAALHSEDYSVNTAEYTAINHWLVAFMKNNDIEFKFINFTDSYKNSAGCHLDIDRMSTFGEFITIEKGSVTDELFEYIRNRFNLPVEIISISIPISYETGMFVTYHTEWISRSVDNEEKDKDVIQHTSTDVDSVNISIVAYTEDASENIDVILSQFGSAIGRCVYDYTEKSTNRYYRSIKMSITLNETGQRLIDSLGWVKDVIVSEI